MSKDKIKLAAKVLEMQIGIIDYFAWGRGFGMSLTTAGHPTPAEAKAQLERILDEREVELVWEDNHEQDNDE